jgi:hypothetical protein
MYSSEGFGNVLCFGFACSLFKVKVHSPVFTFPPTPNAWYIMLVTPKSVVSSSWSAGTYLNRLESHHLIVRYCHGCDWWVKD